jgi:hypothetical protein
VLAEVQEGKNGRKPMDNEQVEDKEEDEEEEEDKEEEGDEEDNNEDELGELENVAKFFWSKRAPTFQERWSKKGILREQAIPVLLDRPYEALKLVWENHRKNLEILEWINSLEEMCKKPWRGGMILSPMPFIMDGRVASKFQMLPRWQ